MKINFEAKNKFTTVVYENCSNVAEWVDEQIKKCVEHYIKMGYSLDEINVSVEAENYGDNTDHLYMSVCVSNQHTERKYKSAFHIGFYVDSTKKTNEKNAIVREWIVAELKAKKAKEAEEAEEALRMQEVAVEADDEE